MLPDGPDVALVLDGEDGVFARCSRAPSIIDMSSIAPAIARRLAARAASLGAACSTHR